MNYAAFIENTLREASIIASTNFGKVKAQNKGTDNNQVLTETDLAVGKLIIEKITSNYPNHNIIDEEAGVINKNSNFTWVVDPIDGTSNYANGLPAYGIMLGLLDNDSPIAGGIALPFYDELYIAEKGKGSFCNGERISITSETNLLSCLVSHWIDAHQENPQITYDECQQIGDIVLNIRNLRTTNAVYDTAMVACGKYGGVLGRSSKIWDNVAQQIIIEEAGGVYTDYEGKPIDYSDPLTKANKNYTFCAAAPALHKRLQEIIHA
jgi:myo-inositol-1(or 4)-monophosphatase